MFDLDATRSERLVVLFLLRRERMGFAFLGGRAAVGVERIESLIAAIGQQFEMRCRCQACEFEQRKVVSFAGTHRDAQNPLRDRIDHELSFLGVELFLAGIAATLFF